MLSALAVSACTPETSIRPDGTSLTGVQAVDCAAAPPATTVMTFGLAYQPTPATITVGGTVQFVMPSQHNVTSATPGLAVGFGASTCLQFSEPGTYTFNCSRHNFTGQVIVEELPPGPGASLQCASSGQNAFETYGIAGFVAVNEGIFAAVAAEYDANGIANLGDSFTKVGSGIPPSTSDDLPTFKGKLAAFLVYAYGGPSRITYTDNLSYEGPQDMTEAHTGLGITSAQFDYFITDIIVPVLLEAGVTEDDIGSCFAPVVTNADFKASMVDK